MSNQRGFLWSRDTPPEQFTPDRFIGVFAHIPDLAVMADYKVQRAEEAFDGIPGLVTWLKLKRREHRGTAQWLKYYLTGDSSVLPELTFDPDLVGLKPMAELIMAEYRLILEVYPRSVAAQELKLHPFWWLYEIRMQDFRQALHNLMQGNVMGKTAAYSYMKTRNDKLKCISTLSKLPTINKNGAYKEFLESQAIELCRLEEGFYPYWQKYLNDVKRFHAKMQAAKDWQMLKLENGYLAIPSGRPKKKRNR
jgi:hypothetical protein